MDILSMLRRSVELAASDVFLIAGLPLTFKIDGHQHRLTEEGILLPQQTAQLIADIYDYAARDRAPL